MKFLHTFTKGGLLVAFLMLLGNFALAQRTVKGKVTDAESGDGLIGATVTVVGTTRGAITDIDGNYSVEVPAGATQLRFAYTGYAESVVALGASNVVDMSLKPGTVLDEVVVVGYGTLKAREVTGSVATVKAENFVKGNVNDPAQLLQGKVAGLSISRPGNDPNGGFNIRLRGLSTLGQNSSPLIVVDGVPGFNLNAIDPNDIESMDVLKDGSAAAIYGTRASSGVILITTRKGQAGKSHVEYTGQLSLEGIERRVKSLNEADYLKFVPGAVDVTPNGAGTDWLDEVTRSGRTQLHSLNMSGGTNKTTYRATLSYRDVNGIAKGTGFDQYLASLNVQQRALNDRLLLTGNLGITNRQSELGFSEAFRYASIFNPSAPILNADGTYYQPGGFETFNPVAIIEQGTNDRDANNYFGNIRADFTLTDGLTLGAFVNRSRQADQTDEFYSKNALYRSGNRGLARSETFNSYNDLLETTLNYDKNFGKLNFKGLLGYSWQELRAKGWLNQAQGVDVDNFGVNNWSAYADLKLGQYIATSYQNQNNIIAQFGRINLGWDDTYYLTASLRREGSSRFGENNKWGLFPAVSAGVSLDKWLSGKINTLKLRAGYGVTGATPRDSYFSIAKVSPSGQTFPLDGTNVPTWGPSGGSNPNADLKWERKSDFNIGVDFGLLDYKLTGSLEYYNSTVSDLIYFLPVPQPNDIFQNTWVNTGKLRNGGVELALTYQATKNWSTSLVGTAYQRTRLLEFYENFKTLEVGNIGAPGQNGSYYQVVSIADSANLNMLGTFVALDIARVGDDGKYVYFDKDGNETTKKADARKVVAGNALPKFELGWTNNFTFGRFDAQVFLRGVFGHSLANEFRVFYENLGDNNGFNKVKTEYFNENLKEGNSYNNTHVEKANFLRIENITLGYNFPLPSGSWFSKARVFVNGQQLFTFTNYSGVDPSPRYVDAGSPDNGGRAPVFQDPLVPGIDRRNTYFTTRTFNLGVNLGF
jgi:TonB-dependent starch-binding outer membrane protein SusC